jgi:hypothetical protein
VQTGLIWKLPAIGGRRRAGLGFGVLARAVDRAIPGPGSALTVLVDVTRVQQSIHVGLEPLLPAQGRRHLLWVQHVADPRIAQNEASNPTSRRRLSHSDISHREIVRAATTLPLSRRP